MARAPEVVRLNAAEFAALAGSDADAERRVARAMRATGTRASALTGATDLVTDGARTVTIANGHPLMAQVTAMGCAGSALVAACLAVEPDRLRARPPPALLHARRCRRDARPRGRAGPGSFAVAILDALHASRRGQTLAVNA